MCAIALERATTEIYKAFIRSERQNKYRIPSDLNINFPRPEEKVTGYLLISLLVLVFWFVDWYDGFSRLWLAVLIGFIGAIGGMLKDAPYEGFDPIRFFRSPVVAVTFGTFLLFLYPGLSPKFYFFSVAGGERILSECYKKILNGRKPGKFKKILHVNRTWKRNRLDILILYIFNLVLLFSLILVR